jgi:hypothetical protein
MLRMFMRYGYRMVRELYIRAIRDWWAKKEEELV